MGFYSERAHGGMEGGEAAAAQPQDGQCVVREL